MEKEIAYNIAQSGGRSLQQLGLRFDKVVLRMMATLRAATEHAIPYGETVILTLTAPIKFPAKTAQALEERILDLVKSGARYKDQACTVFQNGVSIRIAASSWQQAIRLIGLVHNPGTDAKLLLDLAAQWLLSPEKQ